MEFVKKFELSSEFPKNPQTVHFIGIGGGGMSPMARVFHLSGFQVTGSDIRATEITAELQELGIPVQIGHDRAFLGTPDAVVVTTAMSTDNPEYLAALELGIPVFHRSQALAWLANRKRVLALAGAHGKSTSTSMSVVALQQLAADPSFIAGATISQLGISGMMGQGELFVVEADESDGTFMLYDSAVAVVTNVDADHLDYFKTQQRYEDAFVEFAEKVKELVVISADDEGAKRVTERIHSTEVVTFGFSETATIRITDFVASAEPEFKVHYQGKSYQGKILVPGQHNVMNAVGVFAALCHFGFDPAEVLAALGEYRGTMHRFELKGEVAGVRVYDDYGHHPTEITSTLKMATEIARPARVISVYQPKRYTRIQAYAAEFAAALEQNSDYTVVINLYPGSEPEIPGISGQTVVDNFSDQSRVVYLPDWDQAAAKVAEIAEKGDYVVSFSSGDKTMIIPQLISALESCFKN